MCTVNLASQLLAQDGEFSMLSHKSKPTEGMRKVLSSMLVLAGGHACWRPGRYEKSIVNCTGFSWFFDLSGLTGYGVKAEADILWRAVLPGN